MAALKPAICALLTLSSKLHPPLTINANRERPPSLILGTMFFRGEQASRGSALYRVPHSPDPFIDGAEITNQLK